jgi:hypothetical protein
MRNLVLRVALALAVVVVAIVLTAAAHPVGATEISLGAGSATAAAPDISALATALVVGATLVVFVSIFAILFAYRLRPGGVRVRNR